MDEIAMDKQQFMTQLNIDYTHYQMIKFAMMASFAILKRRTKTLPQAQLLRKKIAEGNQINPRLQHLEELKQANRLQDHFASKKVTDLSMQEIYFYLTNLSHFTPPNKITHLAMINNPAIDAYSCFVISQSCPFFEDQQYQYRLLQNFNEGCPLMSDQELVYCLRILKKMDIDLLQKQLNIRAIYQRVNHSQQEIDFNYLEVLLQLNELALLHKVVNFQTLKVHVQNLGLYVAKASTGIKQYYILNQIENLLGITHSKTIQSLREKQIEKKIILAQTPQQLIYTIKIFQKYKQFIYLAQIDKMSPQLYIQFLKFLCNQVQKNPKFPILSHQIPIQIPQQSKSEQFQEIIGLRVKLGLEKENQLGKLVRKIMTYDLECVYGLLIYLHRDSQIDQIKSPSVWIDFEEGFVKALQLNKAKKINIVKITQQESAVQIFKVFAYMAIHKLGSSIFNRHCHLFVHDFLMNENLIKLIPPEDQNRFIIYTFSVYGIRTIPEHIQKKMINLSLVALTNNQWTMAQLYTFTKCLCLNKFGEDEVWYGIQNKILQLQVSRNSQQTIRQKMGFIQQYFRQMNLGSYRFKAKMARLEEAGVLIKPNFMKPNYQKDYQKKFQQLDIQKLEN